LALLKRAKRLDGWDVSLDAPLKEDSDTERIEFLSTEVESVEESVAQKEMRVLLHNKIDEFKKKLSRLKKGISIYLAQLRMPIT